MVPAAGIILVRETRRARVVSARIKVLHKVICQPKRKVNKNQCIQKADKKKSSVPLDKKVGVLLPSI